MNLERVAAHIQIVGWNHRAHLQACLASCLSQSHALPVLYIDNASFDGSTAYVREWFPAVQVLSNTLNRGYAGGHNDGVRVLSTSDVVIVLNPDVVLSRTFVEEILKGFRDPRVGCVVPLLVRANGKGGDAVIDAYGIALRPSLRAVHQYEGHPVRDLAHHRAVPQPPWGFTGAAAALRRTALDDVAIENQIFDEDLFAYREDVDLSWRLHHRGWKVVGAATAQATHARAVQQGSLKSTSVARLSWRNYFLVLMKDVPVRLLMAHAMPVALETLARLMQLIVRPALWLAFIDFMHLMPRFLGKRRKTLRYS